MLNRWQGNNLKNMENNFPSASIGFFFLLLQVISSCQGIMGIASRLLQKSGLESKIVYSGSSVIASKLASFSSIFKSSLFSSSPA
jgi:hypothetical protein